MMASFSARRRMEAKLNGLRADILDLNDATLAAILNSGALDTALAVVRQMRTLQTFGRINVADVVGAIVQRIAR